MHITLEADYAVRIVHCLAAAKGRRMDAKAIAESTETGIHLTPSGCARPFTALTPILTPVNEPGPSVTATKSISLIFKPHALSADSTIGKSV